MDDDDTSGVELETNLNAVPGSNYVEELINDNDLMSTNAEKNLFPEIQSSTFDDDDTVPQLNSVLITEVELEDNSDVPSTNTKTIYRDL